MNCFFFQPYDQPITFSFFFVTTFFPFLGPCGPAHAAVMLFCGVNEPTFPFLICIYTNIFEGLRTLPTLRNIFVSCLVLFLFLSFFACSSGDAFVGNTAFALLWGYYYWKGAMGVLFLCIYCQWKF